MNWYQQGDVLIIPALIPGRVQKISGNVLAEGEATGHKHVVLGENVRLFRKNPQLYVDAPNGAEIRHEEHRPITIPPGTYLIQIVREYDHFEEEVRNVID